MLFIPRHLCILLLCIIVIVDVSSKKETHVQFCSSSQFRCETSGECIHERFFCDKVIDCKDNSDEYTCLDKSQDEYWNVYLKKRPDADRENLPDICILETVPSACECKAETYLYCRDGGLKTFPRNISPNVTLLYLAGNEMPSVSFEDFRDLTQLREVIFIHSGLTQLQPNTFKNNHKIMKLYFTDSKLKALAEDIFPEDNIIEELRLSFNQLKMISQSYFHRLTLLKTLYLNGNMIENITPNSFITNTQLEELILDSNNLEKIDRHFFSNLHKLRKLSLRGNRIKYIASSSFLSLESLTSLSVAENLISKIYVNTFIGLHNLTFLDLQQNEIDWIENTAWKPLIRLRSLDFRKNNIREVDNDSFNGLLSLKDVYFDAFYMCAYVRRFERCYPHGDGISSQENLLENHVLRVTIWIVAILACFGNFAVLLGRFYTREDNQIHSFFIKNLSFADLVMGMYLIIIASHDLRYRGRYILFDYQWRNSWGCDISGMLSTISSEVSVFTLTLITLDRYMCITYPLSLRRRNLRLAYTIMALIWTSCAGLSTLPIMGFTYFGTYFYRNNAVCVPLLLHEPWSKGWEYSAFMFLGLNLLSFAFITYAYCSMFASIRESRMVLRSTHDNQERCLMKRFSLIVITDFICWMPIICLKIAAFGGLDISGDLYSWVVIFVLPINSALNPLLYTLTTKVFKQTFREHLNSMICRRRSVAADAYSTYSISKFRYSRRNTCTPDTELESLPNNGRLVNAWSGKIKYKYSEGKVTYVKGNGPKVLGYSPVTTVST